MKRDSFIPFTLKLRDLKKDVDPKTWKLIEPHVEEIIELVGLNDSEYNKETWNHFSARLADGDFDNESILRQLLAGTPLREALGMFGEDDSFFTKDELLEFASAVVDDVNAYYKSVNSPFSVDYTGAWIEDDDRTITVDFVCFPNETNYSISVKVDMRAIQSPNDLFKYVSKMVEELKKQISAEEVVESKNLSDVEIKLKSIATDDYQGRAGDYPASGEPDTIDVSKNTAIFTFKNTSEERARNWVSRFLTKKGFSVDKISSNQTGDYENDWVDVYAEIGGLIESKHLKESRKFVKGEKFTFKDKYGSTHECTVLSKDLFDEMDYDDYAIGTMTYSYPTLGKPHKETVRILKSEQRDSYGDEYFVSDRKNGIANWVFPNRK